jgi:hypothetical protein
MGCFGKAMGCFGKAMGCFGKTTLFVIGAIVVVVIAVLALGGEGTDPDANVAVPTSRPLVTPADYEVMESRSFEAPNGRTRAELRVQMNPGRCDEAIALGIANAVRETQSTYPGATVFIVFAYSTSDVSSVADVGRGFASVDGRGFAGDGSGLVGEDKEGKIQVDTGGKIRYFEMD